MTNEQVRDYRLFGRLGKGAFGDVWLCEHVPTKERVAVKVINMRQLTERQREDTLQEVALLRDCGQGAEFVVHLRDSFIASEKLFVIMDYIPGGDLAGLISRAKKERAQGSSTGLKEEFVWRIAFQCLTGLRGIHANGMLHRDIKPANVLVDKRLTCFLSDLGLGRRLEESGLARTTCGTPLYMAPEVIGEEPYDDRADMWSLGCLLYECCTLAVPFGATTHAELAHKILYGRADAEISREYSGTLRNMIASMLTRAWRRRPHAADLLDSVRPLVKIRDRHEAGRRTAPAKAEVKPEPEPLPEPEASEETSGLDDFDAELAWLSKQKDAIAEQEAAAEAREVELLKSAEQGLSEAREQMTNVREEVLAAYKQWEASEASAASARKRAEAYRVQELTLRALNLRGGSPVNPRP